MTAGSLSAPQIPLIDCDSYLGRHPRLELGPNDGAATLATMDRCGIELAVVTHYQAVWNDAAAGNDALIDQTWAHRRLLPCWVMLPQSGGELPPPADYVAEARERGVVAFRACPAENVYDLTSPDCRAILDELQRAGLPLLVDADQLSWSAIETVAHDCPELTLIVCRVGYRTLRTVAGVLDRTDNILLDLANLTSQSAIWWLTRRFGAARLLFGTASPVRDPGEVLGALFWSEVSDTELLTIGTENARRVFGLGGNDNV